MSEVSMNKDKKPKDSKIIVAVGVALTAIGVFVIFRAPRGER